MRTAFSHHRPRLDLAQLHTTIESALAAAGLPARSGALEGVTETIRRALAGIGAARPASGVRAPGASGSQAFDPSVIDVVARELRGGGPLGRRRSVVPAEPDAAAPGQVVTGQFRNAAGARTYKLYVPAAHAGKALPLVVMLHGCTQSADDFAVGTRMNRLAEQHGFLVAYPEQSPNANGSNCWNWFKAPDQIRDSGEPSLIAGIVREIVAQHAVLPGRVFVAGLSAGAAMAVILGQTYPELFAAVGAHSGLPYAAAHDVPSAFAAMHGGAGSAQGRTGSPLVPSATRSAATHFVPTIVFHGDADATVQRANGDTIVAEARAALERESRELGGQARDDGASPDGRRYSRTTYADASGRPLIESWLLNGAGHAWSGGDAQGSYTDPTGPDASAEMVRFFLAQTPAGAA